MNDPHLMRIVDAPGAPQWNGFFLAAFDLDTQPGGSFLFTMDPKAAMQFEGLTGVLTAWRTVSTKWPVRPNDGKPNRPMTIFSIEPVPLLKVAGPVTPTPN